MKTEKNILIAFFLNISFSLFELIGGFITNSVAITSDAIHDFGDAISIGLSYFLEKRSKKGPDENYTYGYARLSILGAFITTTILTIGSVLVIVGGIKRIFSPEIIDYNGMIIFAVLGVIVNFLAAYFTKDGDSINQKSVNLHMLEDVLGWVVVLIGSILMKFTDISLIDSIMSICVSGYIFIHACGNFKEIIDLFLEKIPSGLSIPEIKEHLNKIDEIIEVHHIHLWSLDGYTNYATMHVKTNSKKVKELKNRIREELLEHGISHVTIEIEEKDEVCCNEKCVIDKKSVSHTHSHHHH